MAAATAAGNHAGLTDDPDRSGPPPARITGPSPTDRSQPVSRPGRTIRSWPLLVLALPAAAEVWSGWVGIAQKTGFGLVSLLPGIWPSLHLDTTITLPVGVEAYAAYALRAWLASGPAISGRTRRFAKWSAICSFALGMAGQVAYHLLTQAGVTRAPWAITTIVSCLPVLVLAMGTTLTHMLRADAATADHADYRTGGPASVRSAGWSPRDQSGPDQDHAAGGRPTARSGPPGGTGMSHQWDHRAVSNTTRRAPRTALPELDQARLIASRLAASGGPVSRRALRNGGVKGSNEALNLLARTLNAERAVGLARFDGHPDRQSGATPVITVRDCEER
jgi:hypothetical protein